VFLLKTGIADAGLLICIAMVIGAKFGAQFANTLSADTMKKGLGLFFMLVGLKTLLGK
jgi:uncharacterized membrane protein YfcA